MFESVINELIEDGHTSAQSIRFCAQVKSVGTVYNWRKGRTFAEEPEIRRLITVHPSQIVRNAFLRDLTNGLAEFLSDSHEDEVDLDLDGDGDVDLADAMVATMEYEKSAHDTLQLVYEAYLRDPSSITHECVERVKENHGKAIARMKAIDKILSQSVSRRRKAKIGGSVSCI